MVVVSVGYGSSLCKLCIMLVNEFCIECISYLIQIYHIIMKLQLLVVVYVLVLVICYTVVYVLCYGSSFSILQ